MLNVATCAWDVGNASWVAPAVDSDGEAFEIALMFDTTGVYVKSIVKTVY